MTPFEKAVVAKIEALDRGEVATYGEIAEEAGYPGAARAVGNLLAKSDGLPWWRVVGSGGYLKTGQVERQAELLRSEGVEISANRIVGNR